MAALVHGQHAKLIGQFAGYEIPATGDPALSVHQQKVAVGVSTPVHVVKAEAVPHVVIGWARCRGHVLLVLFASFRRAASAYAKAGAMLAERRREEKKAIVRTCVEGVATQTPAARRRRAAGTQDEGR